MDKTTKQRLASYRALRLEVDNQLDRLARLRNEEAASGDAGILRCKIYRRKWGSNGKGHSPTHGVRRELRLRSRRQNGKWRPLRPQ